MGMEWVVGGGGEFAGEGGKKWREEGRSMTGRFGVTDPPGDDRPKTRGSAGSGEAQMKIRPGGHLFAAFDCSSDLKKNLGYQTVVGAPSQGRDEGR